MYIYINQLVSVFIIAALVGIISRILKRKVNSTKEQASVFGSISKDCSFVKSFSDSIQNAIQTILKVGGYIIFFSVVSNIAIVEIEQIFNFCFISNVITEGGREISKILMAGFWEITNGISLISLSEITNEDKLKLICPMLGFSGICVIMQSIYIAKSDGLEIKWLIYGKAFQGIFAYIVINFQLYLFPL
jgi:hypothetical protein